MNKVYLTEITTKDGLIHQGMYFEPSRRSKKAILYIHGLTSAFYHELPLQQAIIDECEKFGIGYASFNNRGHDFITDANCIDKTAPKGKKYVSIGSGVENFSECVFDIDAGITFLKQKGYSSIILIGHSTGANKACYYMGNVNDYRVKGGVFASPICDRLNPKAKFTTAKRLMLKLFIALGLGNTLFINLDYFPITPRRALSLLEPHSDEDVFDYGEKNPRLTAFKKIKKSLLILFGEKDEYVDRSVKTIQEVFDVHHVAKNYQSKIILGAMHGFDGKEEIVAKTIINWIGKNRENTT